MIRPVFMTLLLLAAANGRATDEIEPLDAAFLDYLANMEGDDDDWTLLADAAQKQAPPREATPKPPPATNSKEAAKPAADER